MTRRRALIGAGVLVVLTIATALSWATGRPPGRPAESPPASSATPADRPADLTVAFREDSLFDPSVHRRPTSSANQSKLWFAADSWWATIIEPVRQELRIARLDDQTQQWVDTGVVVDARPQVRAAVAWDGARLAVVTAGAKVADSQAARFASYHYDAPSKRFLIDSDLPISLTASGVATMSVARDAKGVLWLAAIDGGHLLVRHTLGDDYHWSADLGATIAGADRLARTASLTVAGGAAVLTWVRPDNPVLRLSLHRDGAPGDAWSTSTTSVEGLLNAPGALAVVASSGSPDPRVLVAFEAGPTDGASLAPGAVVVVRAPNGTWSTAQLGRAKDHLRDPVLVIDESRNRVFAFAESDGQIIVKPADLGHPTFESGPGLVVIPATATRAAQDPTTVSGPVDLGRGIVVLAADNKAGRYLNGLVKPGGSTGPQPSVAPSSSPGASPSVGPSSSPGPVPGTASVPLRVDRFDPWAVDETPPTWTVSGQSGGRGRASVAAIRSATNRSLRIVTTSRVGGVRACTDVPPTATGTLTITSLVRVGRGATSDTTIGSVRGPGGEAASLRITKNALLAFYRGTTKVTTKAAVRVETWYRLTITMHLAARTWDWSLGPTSAGTIARQAGVAWRQPELTALDTVCAQTGEGVGSTLTLDDVTVAR